MKNLFIKSATCILALSIPLMASGPRVTETLFSPIQNEIVALESKPLYSNNIASGGMVFEIVSAALESEKETATLTTYPVTKMIKYYITQEDTLGALAINLDLSQTEKKSIIAIPVAFIREHYIYYKPAHPEGISLQDGLVKLKGMTYGATPGEDTDQYKKADINVIYGEPRFLFQKLKTQKIDFIKEPALSSKVLINTNFATDKNQFIIMDSQPQKSTCMILFNLQNTHAKDIAKKFIKGLLNVIDNGQYQTILQKYQEITDHDTKDIEELRTLLKGNLQY